MHIRYESVKRLAILAVMAAATYGVSGCKSGSGPSANGTEKVLFDDLWDFHPGSLDSIAAFSDTVKYVQGDTALWRSITLPDDWSIEGNFSAAHPAGNQGGALPGGIGWYRKVFNLPGEDSSKRISIRFEGVYRYSKVWINGHYLGERPNGYISFDYDLTPYLNSGGQPNVVVVRVDNSQQPNSRWYSGSGINRDVYLIKKGIVAIDETESFFYATVNSREIHGASRGKNNATLHQQLVLDIDPSVINLSTPIEVRSSIYDAAHKKVAQKTGEWLVKAGKVNRLDWGFALNDFNAWSPENPYLYTWEVRIFRQGKLVDRLEQPLGIRSFYFDSSKGFFLNGAHTLIKGVCLHSDYGVLGTAYNYSAMHRQLTLLKQMGCNAIRTAHNPPPPGMLDLCDSMGFLVMDEAFDMWQKKKNKFDYARDFAVWHARDLQDQVKRDRHHPSIFMWSIGNEIREQFDTSGIRLTRELAGMVKQLDPTRPVTAAMTETDPEKNNIAKAGALDVLGFNYKIYDYDNLPKSFPGKAFIASETVSALETRGMYKNIPQDSIVYMPAGSGQKYAENVNGDWTVSAYDKVAAYWGTSHENAWRAVKSRPFMSGTFVWTGIDYLGEPVPYPYPARSSYYGIIDQAGLVKDVYYFYQSEWTHKPVLHIFPHWNWKAGDTVDVWCYYSQADNVELFLNGKSLGKRHKSDAASGGNAFHLHWKVPFEPGVLRAVSTSGMKTVLTQEIKTAGVPKKIGLDVDRRHFRGVPGDLCYVTIQLEDQAGIPVPDQDQLLHFDVNGDATLVGVNNGYQADLNTFKNTNYRTWKGKCVAVIRPGHSKGTFTLRVAGKGLTSQTTIVDFDK